MSSTKFSGLNVALLVVTVISLMAGVYGLVAGGALESRPANEISVLQDDPADEPATEDSAPIEARPDKRDDDRPDRQPTGKSDSASSNNNKGQPTVNKNSAELDIRETKSDPSDSGDATISGQVIGPNGKPVSGAIVEARRSDLDLDPPNFRDDDVGRYREQVEDFLRRAAKETRSTTADELGQFDFKGLDGTLAYDLRAVSESIGSGDQNRVAAGDSVIIILSAQAMLRGKVQTSAGEPVTEFTVSYWRLNRSWEARSENINSEDGTFAIPTNMGMVEVDIQASGFTLEEKQQIDVGPDAPETLFVLNKAAVLSGVVADSEGKPLADVVVRVGTQPQGRNNRWNQNQNGPSTRTDSMGRYTLDTLTPKETTISATLGEKSENQKINLTAGDNILNFTMDVGAVIVLRLTNPDGEPLEADRVWFQAKEGRGWPRPERLPAKEPGLAEYAGLNPGEYAMTVTASGFPAIKQDINVQKGSNEFSLQFSNGAMLSGTIASSSGGTVSSVGVRLRKEGEERWGGWGTGRYAQVDESGAFKLGPAEPGQWNIEVYTTNNWTEVYTSTVTLSEGTNTHNIVVDAGATVIVNLVDEQGNPVGWGNVNLRGEKNFNQNADGEGVARISFVEVGSYTLVASARGLASPGQFVSLRSGDNQVTIKLQKPNTCRLTHIYPDTQAAKQGLQVGDLIIEYNGETITSWGSFGQAVRKTQQTDDVVMLVERSGSMLTFNLKGGTVGVEGADGVR